MTRILAFTDPHGEMKNSQAILELAEKSVPDIVLCSGDLTYFSEYDLWFFDRLEKIGKKIYFIPGNHDSIYDVNKIVTKHPFMVDVSHRKVEEQGILIAGVPGNDLSFWPGKTHFDELTYGATMALASGADIFLTHYGPYGVRAVDGTRILTPDSGGSRIIRKIIEDLGPKLVICGHYHQCFGGEGHVNQTRIVNPGPRGTMLELGNVVSSKQ